MKHGRPSVKHKKLKLEEAKLETDKMKADAANQAVIGGDTSGVHKNGQGGECPVRKALFELTRNYILGKEDRFLCTCDVL
jgi:hypothetical protein